MVKVLDHGYVNYIEHWGSDERIIEAARMSTNKGFQGWGRGRQCQICMTFEGEPGGQDSCCIDSTAAHTWGEKVETGDEKLLAYLWNHKHATPFEMAGLVIEVQAPIMVFREWHRHRTQSYNEMSGRYTELPNLYYLPELSRIQRQAKANKQSSEGEFTPDQAERIQRYMNDATLNARQVYEDMLAWGVAREIARLILPVNQYSRMRAQANLRNWLSFLTLRMAPDAQWEIRQFANAVAIIIAERFPRIFALFQDTTGLKLPDYRSNP